MPASFRCSRRRERLAWRASFNPTMRIGRTKDHSKVQYLLDQGIIGAHEVADHPDRNKIFSCLGGLVDPVIDLSRRTPLRNGDILVLCTDGLWSVYPQEEIARALTGTTILKAGP